MFTNIWHCYTINGYWLECGSATSHDCTITWRQTSQGHAVSWRHSPASWGLVFCCCSRLSVFSSHSGVRALAAQLQDRFYTLFYFLSDRLCSCVLCFVSWWRMIQVMLSFVKLSYCLMYMHSVYVQLWHRAWSELSISSSCEWVAVTSHFSYLF